MPYLGSDRCIFGRLFCVIVFLIILCNETTDTTTTVATTTVKVKPHGVSCSQTSECAAGLTYTDSNKRCDSTNTEYYDASNTGSLCLPKKTLGQSCNQSVECIDNLSCISGICRCTDSQYYNITPGDLCRPRNILKLNVTSVIRQTTNITLYWTDTSDRNDVIYNITWNGASATATKTGGSVTGFTPGTQYTFVIYSTLAIISDGNYSSFVEQSSYTYWTYPAMPGNIDQVSETSQQFVYEITFTMSVGSVVNYKMDITGGGITNSVTTNTLSVTFQLTPATQYNYTLTAYNGNSPPDQSEPRIGTFLTPPTASGSVQGLAVTDVSEMTANITWQTPSHPNGHISGYLVQVIEQWAANCLYNIRLPCYNCDQSNPPNVSDAMCTITETVKSTYDSNTEYYHLELPKLKPYHNYTVVVRAINEKENGRPRSTNITTKIAVANSLSSLSLDSTIDESKWWVNLNISWIPGDYTGPTTYYILVQKHLGPDSKDFSTSSEFKVSDYYTNTFDLYDVQANWNYQISVKAGTSKGNSSWSTQQISRTTAYPESNDAAGAIVGGIFGGLAFILVGCVMIVIVWRFRRHNGKPARMVPSRSTGIAEQKNGKTENFMSSETTPGVGDIPDTSREHPSLQQIAENENVYAEVDDYDYIESEDGLSSRYPEYIDIISDEDLLDTSEFPYRNTVTLSDEQDNSGYTRF